MIVPAVCHLDALRHEHLLDSFRHTITLRPEGVERESQRFKRAGSLFNFDLWALKPAHALVDNLSAGMRRERSGHSQTSYG